jgi:hypothetical protein
MEANAAKKIVESIFSSKYSRDNFKRLAAEVFNGYHRKEQIIDQKEGIKNFTNLGLFEDEKDKKIAVFEVELLSENSLYRARVNQRNLIANQLKIYGYDGALCSFYHTLQGEWRLSFITRESSIDLSSNNLKIIEHLSPSKRQSFIAGPNEGTHTAQKQFLPRIASNIKPSFDDIASIFKIEAVNDDFYRQYKELYLRLTEELNKLFERDSVIAADFIDKEVSASDFAKKTLGQFVFLYFIQKKGWLKDKENSVNSLSFTKLFDSRNGKNFFNDLMEPIFYELLAKKDPNLDKYPVLKNYEFPYLGGGLFDPIRDYDWEKTNIIIPDTFFKNDNETKEGVGDGLLDVFNRFNFTVHENDSIEQDIAVDPEMLGKVFENLLDIKDRKSKGAFYTPREIVQYMCQESLINYLITEIGDEIPSTTLKFFITNYNILETTDIKGTELEIIAENAIDLDQLLASIKVCDPAVGSGAFPMGMLSEIIGARGFLQKFLSKKQTIYDLKLHTIGESLYGVDIDPSAVEIARLRFWLSLIIEEDTPTPLPNLEHKLMQGNSLLSSYKGVEFFNDKFLANADIRKEKLNSIMEEEKVLEKELKEGINTTDILRIQAIQKHLISLGKKKKKLEKSVSKASTKMLFEDVDILSKIKRQVDLLQSKIAQFLLPDANLNKEELKKEIENIKWELIEASVESEEEIKSFQQLRNKRVQPFFLWKLEFIDVFRDGDGFDIIIGNPPYNDYRKIDKEIIKSSSYPINKITNRPNLYQFFIELGDNLLGEKGVLSFINPNQFLSTNNGFFLRKFLLENRKINFLVDVSYVNVFFNASTYTVVWQYNKIKPLDGFKIRVNSCKKLTDLSKSTFNLDSTSLRNSENKIIPLNKNFLLLEKFEKGKTKLKDVAKLIWGTSISGFAKNKINITEYNKLSTDEKDLYKPVIVTADIKKYFINWKEEFILRNIYTNKVENIFSNEKIVIGRLTKFIQASLDSLYYVGKATVIYDSKIELKILLAIINSKFIYKWYFYRYESTHMAGGYIRYDIPYLSEIPIPFFNKSDKTFLINKIDQIEENLIAKKDINKIQEELDLYIFNLYGLNEEEVSIFSH